MLGLCCGRGTVPYKNKAKKQQKKKLFDAPLEVGAEVEAVGVPVVGAVVGLADVGADDGVGAAVGCGVGWRVGAFEGRDVMAHCPVDGPSLYRH